MALGANAVERGRLFPNMACVRGEEMGFGFFVPLQFLPAMSAYCSARRDSASRATRAVRRRAFA